MLGETGGDNLEALDAAECEASTVEVTNSGTSDLRTRAINPDCDLLPFPHDERREHLRFAWLQVAQLGSARIRAQALRAQRARSIRCAHQLDVQLQAFGQHWR